MFDRNPQCLPEVGVIIHPGCAEDTINVTNIIEEISIGNWTLVLDKFKVVMCDV